jgi:hypothetical protein
MQNKYYNIVLQLYSRNIVVFSKSYISNIVDAIIMYAKVCQIEILSSYLTEVTVGDMLSVQSLITNPLDWHHFYDKISTIKKGSKTDFIVVTDEGDRIAGSGEVIDMEKWSNHGHFGFKIKIKIKKQKSSSDRRIRPIYSTVQQTTIPKQVADKEFEIPNIRQPLSA